MLQIDKGINRQSNRKVLVSFYNTHLSDLLNNHSFMIVGVVVVA